jgi:hypothetical protein
VQNDVFLLTSNAMSYNSDDTVYHRQVFFYYDVLLYYLVLRCYFVALSLCLVRLFGARLFGAQNMSAVFFVCSVQSFGNCCVNV